MDEYEYEGVEENDGEDEEEAARGVCTWCDDVLHLWCGWGSSSFFIAEAFVPFWMVRFVFFALERVRFLLVCSAVARGVRLSEARLPAPCIARFSCRLFMACGGVNVSYGEEKEEEEETSDVYARGACRCLRGRPREVG